MFKIISTLALIILLTDNLLSQCIPPLVLTTSATPSTCGLANGTANVLITDPIGIYTYAWSPGGGNTATVTNLAGGNYSVIVTDEHGCSVTGNVSVATSTPVTLATSSTPSQCNASAGSASVVASGGTAPYTYAWSPSGGNAATASNISSGNFTVTVTDATSNCTATQTVTVINSNAPIVDVDVTPSACTGATGTGIATASATGGTGSYTYLWTHNASNAATQTGLTAGNYTVIVMDGVCSVVKTVTVTKEENTLNVITYARPASCGINSGDIIAIPSSVAVQPFTFVWTPNVGTVMNVTDLAPGTYSVLITDANGCTGTQTAVVGNEPLPTIDIVSISHPTCHGAQDGFYTYSINGGPTVISYGLYAAGTYTDTVRVANTYSNQCRVTYSVTFVDPPDINASITTTPSACGSSNGGASVNVAGGFTPHSYLWSNSSTASSISGMPAGSYSVEITDANGCKSNQTVQIPSVNGPVLTMSSTPSNCGNGTASVAVTGGTAPYNYSWSPSGGSSPTASSLAAGIYTVTVTDAANCVGTGTVEVTPQHTLTITRAGAPYSCANANAGTLYSSVNGLSSPAGMTYLWAPNGETTPNILNLNPGVYSVWVTDANGCTGFGEFQINLTQSPIAEIIDIKHPSCFGALDGSYTVALTYPESFGNLPNAIVPQTVNGLSANTYNGGSTGPCGGGTFSVTLINPPQIVASITSVNGSCSAAGSATVTASGGTGAFSYAWSPSGGTGATASNLAPGTYTVTVTDANGCSVEQSATITSSSTLLTTSSSTPASCGLANGSATVTPAGGATPYTYAWSPSGGTAATATNLAAGNYSVVVTDANNCTASQSVTVASISGVTATTTSTSASCGLANGSATVIPAGGATPYTYAWSPSGGTAATAPNLAAGNYSVVVTDANSCTATQSVTVVSASSGIIATAGSTPATCGLSNGTVSVMATGGAAPYTYAWSPAGGTTAAASGLPGGNYTVTVTDASNCATTQTITLYSSPAMTATTTSTPASCGLANGSATVTPTSTPGPYTYAWTPAVSTGATASNLAAGSYTVVVTNGNNCSVSNTIVVASASSITATATATLASCTTANGSATVTANGGTAPYTYAWSPSGGTAATASNLAAGTYTVTVTDANNCSATTSVTIVTPAAPTLTASATAATCFGQNNGSATATVAGGTAPYTYDWLPSGGAGATASNLMAGSYAVTITDNNGCTQTQTVVVTQPASIAVTTSGNPAHCDGTPGSLNAVTSGGTAPISYVWQPGNLTGPAHSGIAAGVYSVTVTDANGCSTTATSTVSSTGALPVSVDPVTSWIDAGDTVALEATDIPGATYSWTPATGLSCTNCHDPLAFPTQSTLYTVTVTAPNGCTGTADAKVNLNIICTEHFIPTIFSPNGDSRNDEFLILGNCIVKFNVKVFDRWGEKVFESSDQSIGWDGTYKGQPMNPAAFVFVADLTFLDGTSLLEKGNLTLVR